MAKDKKKVKEKKVKKDNFFKQVKKEVSLVKWPKAKEVIKYSVATIVFCLIVAGFFVALNALMSLIVERF